MLVPLAIAPKIGSDSFLLAHKDGCIIVVGILSSVVRKVACNYLHPFRDLHLLELVFVRIR